MIVVDTNVLLDVLQNDPHWAHWSVERLADARAERSVVINAVVVAELSRDYANIAHLRTAIRPLELVMEPIDDAAAFLAGHRFVAARKRRAAGTPQRPLPDFFIGAHAATLGVPVLTRDAALYRRNFPELALITPETHP